MKVTVSGFFVAEGSEVECAAYTCYILEFFRVQSEKKTQKEFNEWLEKYGDMTFEQLMKRERDEEE